LQVSLTYKLAPPPTKLGISSEIESFQGGKVTLSIVGAKDLIAMDTSTFRKKGNSDPFCKITCRDLTSNKMELFGKTKTIKKTLNPKWKSEHSFLLTDHHSSIICISLWDHDAMSASDPMGAVNIPLSNFLNSDNAEKQLEVEPCEGCDTATGTITVKVSEGSHRRVSIMKQSVPSSSVPPFVSTASRRLPSNSAAGSHHCSRPRHFVAPQQLVSVASVVTSTFQEPYTYSF